MKGLFGTPVEIYTKPANLFVATFIGKPRINLFNVTYHTHHLILSNHISLEVGSRFSPLTENGEYLLALRAEHLYLDTTNGIEMRIQKVEYLGSEVILHLQKDDLVMTMKSYQNLDYKTGAFIKVSFDLAHAHVFNKTTHERIELNHEQN